MRLAWALLVTACLAAGLRAEEPPLNPPLGQVEVPPQQTVDAQAMDHAFLARLGTARYAWRSDRAARQATQDSLVVQTARTMVAAVNKVMGAVFSALGRAFSGFFNWLDSLFRRQQPAPGKHAPQHAPSDGEGVLYAGWALLTLAMVGLGLFVHRRLRRPPVATAVLDAVGPVVDLSAPQLSGAELPEDAWLDLARQLEAQGQWRLALRAYFLAALNTLGQGGWLKLASSRSVGEYRRQLARRGAAEAQRRPFEDFCRLYEGVWYGTRASGAQDCAQARQWQEALHGPPA